MPDHDAVDPHRGEGLGGVLQALALRDARALRAKLMTSARQSLGGGLERDAGAGRVLEEQVHDGPCRAGSAASGPRGWRRRPCPRRCRGCRSRRRGRGRRCESRCLMPHRPVRWLPCSMTTSSRRRSRSARTLMRSAVGGRQVLAHEVGADRQLAVAAVDEHGEAHGPGPAEIAAARRARPGSCGPSRARRRPGRRSCRRCRRPGHRRGAVRDRVLRRRSSRYIVTSRATRRDARRRSTGLESARMRPMRSASTTPRVGMPRNDQIVGPRGWTRGSRARCGSEPA